MDLQGQRIVGDIKIDHPTNREYYETVLRELEDFMRLHRIAKIDVGWSLAPITEQKPDHL